jgi:hypothetical protein
LGHYPLPPTGIAGRGRDMYARDIATTQPMLGFMKMREERKKMQE